MLRYCIRCKENFEFAPGAVSGKGDLICPKCGGIIAKNSRHPTDSGDAEKIEEGMGRTLAGLFRFFYFFYLIIGIAGVLSFWRGFDKLLYVLTIIALCTYIFQLFTGTSTFMSGIIFLPSGALLGYLYFKNIAGVCLGIHIVFLIRHLIRDLVYGLIFKLIKMGSDR